MTGPSLSTLLRHACNRGLAARAGTLANPATRAALAAEWRPRLRDHTRIWLARNRPGGLRDSLARMQTLLKTYID